MHDRIVREEERRLITGYSGRHWRRLEENGAVPRRRKLGPRAVGWFLSELTDWVNRREAA